MEDSQQFADPSVTIRSVCFHCEKKVTAEMVKKSIQEVDIESCVLLDDSNCDVLVVFKHKAGNYSLLKYCIPLVAPVRRWIVYCEPVRCEIGAPNGCCWEYYFHSLLLLLFHPPSRIRHRSTLRLDHIIRSIGWVSTTLPAERTWPYKKAIIDVTLQYAYVFRCRKTGQQWDTHGHTKSERNSQLLPVIASYRHGRWVGKNYNQSISL